MIMQNSSAGVDMQEPMESAPSSSNGKNPIQNRVTLVYSNSQQGAVMMMMESLFWQPVLS